MSLNLDRIRQEVSETKTVQASAASLLRSIAQQLRDLVAQGAADQDAVNSLADEMDASANDLGAAVAENTAAEDEPTEPEVPPTDPEVPPTDGGTIEGGGDTGPSLSRRR